MQKSFKELIYQGQLFAPTYKNGLSSHLPMALYALKQIGGCEEKLNTFYGHYIKRLELPSKDTIEINKENWSSKLGQYHFFSSHLKFFKEEINSLGTDKLLEKYIPTLMHGVGAGAFHSLIRLAYGLEMNDVNEVVISLSNWSDSYLELAPTKISKNDTSLLESLLTLKEIGDPSIRATGIFRRMEIYSKETLFKKFALDLNEEEINIENISKLTVKLYLNSKNNFTALHALTSAHALRVVSSYTLISKEELALYITALGAAFIDSGVQKLEDNFDFSTMRDWDTIKNHCRDSHDDHLIKLCYSCYEQFQYYQDPLFQLAISNRLT